MASDPVMAAAMRLGTAVDTLAAIGARARIDRDGVDVDPRIRGLLDEIVAQATGGATSDESIDPAVAGLVHTLFALGLDMIQHPARSAGWEHTDTGLLQSIGRLSGSIAGAIATACESDHTLAAVLRRDGARFLDIGSGTGWLAIAMARTFPNLQVVGIDVLEPAVDLARQNVDGEGLSDRVELRLQDATLLDEDSVYDAAWIALPFMPQPIVPEILDVARRALRPGGLVIPGTFNQHDDALAQALIDLRTLRSGGHPWRPAELISLLAAHEFRAARHQPRSWPAPVELYTAERP